MNPMLMMALAGLAKSELVDRPQANKQRELAAKTQMYSPWTGLSAHPVKEADPFGSTLQYGATGAAMQTGMQNADSNEKMADAYKQSLVGKTNIEPGFGGGAGLGSETTFEEPSWSPELMETAGYGPKSMPSFAGKGKMLRAKNDPWAV